MSRYFPKVDIPESQRNEDWARDIIEYGIYNYGGKREREIKKISRNINRYNRIVDKTSVAYLTNNYGKTNSTKFIDYGVGRTKIDLITGEHLSIPLSPIIQLTNREAKSKMLDDYHTMVGMSKAKNQIDKLRNDVGVNVFDGMPIPEENDEQSIWESMTYKNKNLVSMQMIANHQVEDLDLKTKFNYNIKDAALGAECFGKVEVFDDGNIGYRRIDPRDMLFEEKDEDPFVENSPYIGERRRMYVHEILEEFGHLMTKEQRDEIDAMKHSYDDYFGYNRNGRQYYYRDSETGNLLVNVYNMEWKAVTPYRVKIVESKKNKFAKPLEKDLSNEYYEKNKKKIDRDVRNGKYKIETRYSTEIYEATQIGHRFIVGFGKQKYQDFKIDSPDKRTYSYMGLLVGNIDGYRVSLMEIMNELSHTYNVIMYKINNELQKAKGKVVVYDKAWIPSGKRMTDVLYQLTNDALLEIDTTEENMMGDANTINTATGIKEIDLGISNSVAQLIALKLDIQETLDRLTGINENRQGAIPASSTATGALEAIKASRTITAPLFYFFNKFEQRVIEKIVCKTKFVWGSGNFDKSEIILGDKVNEFIQVNSEMMDYDYGVYLSDGRREKEIKDMILNLSQLAINSGELRVQDTLRIAMAKTLSEAEAILDESWDKIKDIESQNAQANAQAAMKSSEIQLQIAREDREDRQQHDRDMKLLEAELDSRKETQKASNEMVKKGAENLMTAST